MEQSRRSFLRISLTGLGAAAVVAVLYPIYRFLGPQQNRLGGAKISIPEADVAEGDAKLFELGGSAGILIKRKGGNLVVLSAVCTHLGCIVQWQKDGEQLLCPCHGGVFGAEGSVISGPPPKPLQKLPFTVVDGMVVIG